jgi:hypothetical protein
MTDLEFEAKLPEFADNCPAWASQLIHRIYLIEIETGAIPNPKNGQWSTATQDQLLKLAGKMDQGSTDNLDGEAESLFAKVVRGLTSEHLTPEQISAMINRRIPTGTKLNYCSPSEVLEASFC